MTNFSFSSSSFSVFVFVFVLSRVIIASPKNHPATDRVTRKHHTLPPSDVVVHKEEVNPHDFSYIHNPGHTICQPMVQSKNSNQTGKIEHKVYVIIYVHTAPANLKRRISIRETWSKRSMFRDVRIVFCMGQSSDRKVRDSIRLEADQYMDIVQEDFMDSYRNLTYKGVMAMKWLSEYCVDAKHVLKVDDDIINNMFILLRHLKSLDEHNVIKERTLMCLNWVGMKVLRDPKSKWYLSEKEYPWDVYGKYCSGSAYLFSPDMPKIMYETSKHMKFFWVDDYYITGMLARGVNATYQQIRSLYIISQNLVEQKFTGSESEYTVFGHIPSKQNVMYKLWDFILKHQLSNHPQLFKSKTTLLVDGDFKYLKDLMWTNELWAEFFPKVDTSLFEKSADDYY